MNGLLAGNIHLLADRKILNLNKSDPGAPTVTPGSTSVILSPVVQEGRDPRRDFRCIWLGNNFVCHQSAQPGDALPRAKR
jgi:hypothetical protein